MFKPFCFCAAIPLALTSKSVLAQDKQPQPPPMTALSSDQQAAAPKPEKPVPLSQGQLKLGDRLIVPGRRIGRVELGMPLEQVEKMFGPPADTTKMYEDFSYSVWRWKTQAMGEPQLIFFLVICQNERVVQIETNHPAFALPNGLSSQSSEEQWMAFWGEKPERCAAMRSIVPTPLNVNWKKRGFALQVAATNFLSYSPPKTQSVMVFPTGRLAMPTYGLWSLVSLKDPNAKPSAILSSSLNKTGAESTPAPEKNPRTRIGRPR